MSHSKTSDDNIVHAYAPDQSLRELIGKSTALTDIFTQEKIAACQKLVDDAKGSFFDTVQPDIDIISNLAADKAFADDYQELCKRLFQPVSNIKGQADAFGFSLIARVCKYLIEYCDSSPSAKRMTAKDIFIITKLVEALRTAFQERIMDAGGAMERELVSIIELVRK